MLKAGARWMGSLLTGGMMGPPKSLLDNSPLRELLAQVDGLRRDARQRGATATCAHWRCAPPAISRRARCRSSKPRPPSANGRARSVTANACRCRSITSWRASAFRSCFRRSACTANTSATAPCARRRRSSPAIHLGADRLLVLGVRPTHLDLIPRFVASDSPPTPGQLFGYMLDTLFSDQISADLENLTRINRLSALAGAAIGTRQIRTLMIAPSVDPSAARRAPRGCAALEPACADAHHRRAWLVGQPARELPDVRRRIHARAHRDSAIATRSPSATSSRHFSPLEARGR